jgi:hypothetical protein
MCNVSVVSLSDSAGRFVLLGKKALSSYVGELGLSNLSFVGESGMVVRCGEAEGEGAREDTTPERTEKSSIRSPD